MADSMAPFNASTTSASFQLASPLGLLPRELRDLIYHFLFLKTPYLIQRFSSYDATSVNPPEAKILPPMANYYAANLLYLRYRQKSNAQGPNRPSYGGRSSHPEWLRVCQMFTTEGLQVFMRNAEWYFHGYGMRPEDTDHWTNRSLQVDTSKVTGMHLYVENLSNFSIPYRYEGTDTRADQEYLARLMRKTGVRLKEMRFVGHSYYLRRGNESCDGQVGNMMRNLVGIFHDIGVSKWEFGVVEPRNWTGLWVLYEWVVESGKDDTEGYLRKVLRTLPERHVNKPKPEDDLENLLPQGWVKKRPVCVCARCEEYEEETGIGGWGPRPDQFGRRVEELWH